jgi:hypothetical protein
MFKSQFAPMVKSGAKRQTIRPTPKRMPKVGDFESWRQWSDKPYRSPTIELAKVELTVVENVTIFDSAIYVGCQGWAHPVDTVAEADGFKNFVEMRDWFKTQYGLPFTGIFIRSKDLCPTTP